MTPVLDPEGAHLAALRRLGDFRGQRVLELGCGDGRLTADAATAAVDALVRARILSEQAVDKTGWFRCCPASPSFNPANVAPMIH